MLRVELVEQLLRWRSLVILAALAAVPLVAGPRRQRRVRRGNHRDRRSASMRGLTSVLPVHYWPRWTQLLDGGSSSLISGLAVRLTAIAIVMAAACAILGRRDPAA